MKRHAITSYVLLLVLNAGMLCYGMGKEGVSFRCGTCEHLKTEASVNLCMGSRIEAVQGKTPIGHIEYHRKDCKCKWCSIKKDSRNKCTMYSLYVEELYRNNGIGSRLFAKAVDDMHQSGCDNITWFSTLNARDFYKKQGADGGVYMGIDPTIMKKKEQ